ncbi:MAG TPA: DinB family protein [Candidatus Ruania gallistercoris]|uniref:DinB family protein n=1 Tax=Candidatus Ruania gallistercoris TaxID=2838746 RepID=A0A9D2EG04_9MICO|nr:DinB family protein [Candidatus Ruania gallistercoris]
MSETIPPLPAPSAQSEVPLDDEGRVDPPLAVDEWHTLTSFLDFQRGTLHWKCSGLDAAGLNVRVAASTMTLGGILKHMAWVEEHWFTEMFLGQDMPALWQSVDWNSDPDWEWTSAVEDSPHELFTLWQDAVSHSRETTRRGLTDGLSTLAIRGWPDGQRHSLRWILVHMIEEYARHNGHADLIREAIDGSIGE